MRVEGLGFRVIRVKGLGLGGGGGQSLGLRLEGLEFRVLGPGRREGRGR